MEHNTEKNIRLKIQEAEQYPVRWGKEELWARMEIHRTTRSKRPVYFSMAASLTVAVLAGVYSYQRVADIPGRTIKAANTELTQPATADKSSSFSKDIPAVSGNPQPHKTLAQNSARIRIEEEPYISTLHTTTADTVTTPEATANTTDNIVAVAENTNTEAVAENSVNRPRVIIGIIPPQEQPFVTKQEKKKKFRFLKGKPENGNTEGNELIIARIN